MKTITYVLLFVVFLKSMEVEGRSNCPTFGKLDNGRVKIRSRGRLATFRCRRKYMLYGSKMAECIGQTWNYPLPVCIASKCPDVTADDNVQMTADPKYKGALLKFSCGDGLQLQGEDTLYCNGFKWNGKPPTCIYGTADLQCDFESMDLCGWSQATDDDFDWIWHTGTPQTIGTGPTQDHTFHNGSTGHYLYIDASFPRQPGDAAILKSPLYPPMGVGFCFELWYHLLSPDSNDHVGSLKVYVLQSGTDMSTVEPIFQTDGNKGDVWVRAKADIGSVNAVFNIVIVATRKISYRSDIAIDDLRLYSCSEDWTEETTSSTSTDFMEETTKKLTQSTKESVSTPPYFSSAAQKVITTKETALRSVNTKQMVLQETSHQGPVTETLVDTQPTTHIMGTTVTEMKQKNGALFTPDDASEAKDLLLTLNNKTVTSKRGEITANTTNFKTGKMFVTNENNASSPVVFETKDAQDIIMANWQPLLIGVCFGLTVAAFFIAIIFFVWTKKTKERNRINFY